MDSVRRRVSSIFSPRAASEDRAAAADGPRGSSSLNRSGGPGPSAVAGPQRGRYNSRGSPATGERLPEGVEFIRLVKAFRYDHENTSWLPASKGYVRILSSASTGLRRLQVRTNSTYGREPSRLVINCFITSTMTLFPYGERAYTFSTAADWSFGEQTWETFAIRFAERDGGTLFATEFAREFDKAQAINVSLLEEGAKEEEEEHDKSGLMRSMNGSKTSLGSFGASAGRYGGSKLTKQPPFGKKSSVSRSPEERWRR